MKQAKIISRIDIDGNKQFCCYVKYKLLNRYFLRHKISYADPFNSSKYKMNKGKAWHKCIEIVNMWRSKYNVVIDKIYEL